jgi:hypothetical protein
VILVDNDCGRNWGFDTRNVPSLCPFDIRIYASPAITTPPTLAPTASRSARGLFDEVNDSATRVDIPAKTRKD